MTIGVYPGSFAPLTIAHLAVADVAREHLGLTRLDLAISRDALGKPEHGGLALDARVEQVRDALGDRDWLDVVVVDARLIVDIAAGYDVVVMGADKWAQVNDPVWYDGDPAARDRALATLPRVGVAPRSGEAPPAELLLPVPEHLWEVSSTAVRAGRHDWAAPGTGSAGDHPVRALPIKEA